MMTNVARKVLKLVQQFYTERKMLTIAGSQEPIIYDPDLCGDIDADVTLYDKDDAPNANSVGPDLLTMLLNRGDIDGRQYVELGDWNFKQRVLRAMADKTGTNGAAGADGAKRTRSTATTTAREAAKCSE